MRLKVDSTKFKIVDAYWFDGDAYKLPGYYLFITLKNELHEGKVVLHGVEVCPMNNELNKDWVIEDKE